MGVGRYKRHFASQRSFYERAAAGTLPALSWLMPPLQVCVHQAVATALVVQNRVRPMFRLQN